MNSYYNRKPKLFFFFALFEFTPVLLEQNTKARGCLLGVVANVLYSNIIVNEFKLQSDYYIHF